MAKDPIILTPEEARRAILNGAFPEGASVEGDLFLVDRMELAELPDGLQVQGMLRVARCHRLRRLPRGLRAASVSIEDCAGFEGFPADCRSFEVEMSLHFSGCPALQAFPERLSVGGDFALTDCPRAWDGADGGMPGRLSAGGCAFILACDRLTGLPAATAVREKLELADCNRLRQLPARLSAGGLSVEHCASFEGFHPDDCSRKGRQPAFTVPGGLHFQDCPALERFPKALHVGGAFRMARCARAWAEAGPGAGPPEELRVGKWAHLEKCVGLARLPRRMEVGMNLVLRRCHLIERIGGAGAGRPPVVGGHCTVDRCDGLSGVDALAFTGEGSLDITECRSLEAVGDGVRPESEMAVAQCPRLSRLPRRLVLAGVLTLADCPSLAQAVTVEGGGRLATSGSTPWQSGLPAPGRSAGPPAP